MESSTNGIYLSRAELDALYGLPALAQRLYVHALKPTMGREFEAGGEGRASLSWHGIARELRVESAPGIKEELPSKSQVRRAAKHLVKQGLITERTVGYTLIFGFPMAKREGA